MLVGVQRDVIVVGLGGIGSAILHALATRGIAALGVDRFAVPHERGGTAGPTRTFREAYFDDPRHVRMACEARERWLALESDESLDPGALFEPTGALLAGPSEHPVVRGVATSLETHALSHERLAPEEIRRRWPALRPLDDELGLFEHRAGLLQIPAAWRAHLEGARRRGASVITDEAVVTLSLVEGGVEVRTSVNRYQAGAAILALGPWLANLDAPILGYAPPLTICRQPQLFFAADFAANATLPVFNYALGEASFYGVPDHGRGVMVAQHYGGDATSADGVERALRPTDADPVRAFLRARLPDLDRPPRDYSVGLYTNTPDRRFLLGPHPASPRVVIAGGLSGHGYKFAPVIGEIAADLATHGATSWDLAPFAPGRFSRT